MSVNSMVSTPPWRASESGFTSGSRSGVLYVWEPRGISRRWCSQSVGDVNHDKQGKKNDRIRALYT